MILLPQHRPGSSTSISSPSLQPLISLSSSLFWHPILWIIFNHLPLSLSLYIYISHTHKRQIRHHTLNKSDICMLSYDLIRAHIGPKTSRKLQCCVFIVIIVPMQLGCAIRDLTVWYKLQYTILYSSIFRSYWNLYSPDISTNRIFPAILFCNVP